VPFLRFPFVTIPATVKEEGEDNGDDEDDAADNTANDGTSVVSEITTSVIETKTGHLQLTRYRRYYHHRCRLEVSHQQQDQELC
jgi:hypothetical protein